MNKNEVIKTLIKIGYRAINEDGLIAYQKVKEALNDQGDTLKDLEMVFVYKNELFIKVNYFDKPINVYYAYEEEKDNISLSIENLSLSNKLY